MKNFNYAAVSGGRGVPCGLNTTKSLISYMAYNVICNVLTKKGSAYSIVALAIG
jgi:hypothetical protein